MNVKSQKMMDRFQKLVHIPGASGFEEKVVEFIVKEFKEILSDVSIDSMGNVIGKLGKDGLSIMLCCHTDEVSLIVKYIDPQGYLFFDLNGMIDERVLLSTKMDIYSEKGIYTGVVGVKNRHLISAEELKRPISVSELWIDVGSESMDEVKGWGIEIGDPIVYHPNFQFIGEDTVISKAIDNRVGCALLIEMAELMGKEEIDYQLFLVAAVQEEVGSRGAKVAAQTLEPDIAIIIDTVPARDPITPPQQATGECGKGPIIRAMDHNPFGLGTIYSKKISKKLTEIALKNQILYQKDIFKTWTDASTIHTTGKGIPCGGLFIPRRYSHSPMELVKWSDVEMAKDLLFLFLKDLTSAKIEDLCRKT